MPELPEVEVTRLGLLPYLQGKRIHALIVRRHDLRWPIPQQLPERLAQQRIECLERRAKYLLLATARGSALIHLGMTGSLRILESPGKPGVHAHWDLQLEDGRVLRYTDPRRFGCLLWQAPGQLHPLLAKLGPEPLSEAFTGELLWQGSRRRKVAVKVFLMNQSNVVGVGNIYASEALFAAGINPARAAGGISRKSYLRLAAAVRDTLRQAIRCGGTTLRDFHQADGQAGYFYQELSVYDRQGQACRHCGTAIRQRRLGQRASYYCPHCQT